jgi:hypothetical protein
MNTSKSTYGKDSNKTVSGLVFTLAMNFVLAVSVVGLFTGESTTNDKTEIAKVESITIVAKRV